jgi:hypothetical protein
MVSERVTELRNTIYRVSTKNMIAIKDIDDLIDTCGKVIMYAEELETSRDNLKDKYKKLQEKSALELREVKQKWKDKYKKLKEKK